MPNDLIANKVEIGVLADTVTIEIKCGDAYLARVLYDDIVEQMEAGERVSLGIVPKLPTS
jgi:hypothetical protein